nr:reverse transcriptase domain-containing protein [Tanacetum cinerariifolium]
MTKSGPDREYSKDDSHSRGRPHKRNSSPSRDYPRNRGRSHDIEESHGTARIWFDELPSESIDGYTDLKAALLAYFMQQKKYVKDPVEIHNIKQKDGETIEEFMERFKIETGRMKGAPKCMRISGFMHGVNNPELIKRLNEHVPKTLEEMMTATAAFIRGETVFASKKKVHTPWKSQDQPKRQNSERRFDLRSQPRDGRGSNKFTPLTRTPKEIFTAESRKFKPPPPMVTPVEKRSSNKFCEFHNDKGHNTDECVQLRKQIEELKVTQSFAQVKEITFSPLAAHKGTRGPLVIEAEISGHVVHRIYVDGGSSMEALGNYRGRGALYKTMDEFYDIEVTITIQRHHRKAWDKRNPSNTIHDSQNAQIPGEGRNTKGMFIGYMINPEGIKPCPDKTEAVLQLPSPRIIKKVQGLNGKLASLNRFISKLAEKSLPLFKTLKKCIKKSYFHWTLDAKQAFKQQKQHLARLPILVAPKPKEELIMYLSASYGAISAVLMTERDTVQTPVYFVSRALQTPELNYTLMEMLVLKLVCAAKRLRRYFQAHLIAVITDQHIKQILADFLVEKPDDAPPKASVIETPQESRTLFTKGTSCVDESGVGLTLTSPKGTEFTYALRFQFTASNNKEEYEALIADLWIATQIGVCNVHVSIDSTLVANQVLGTYVAKEENMVKYLEKAKSLISGFANFSISQAPRSKNKKADALSKIASTSFAHLSKQVLVEDNIVCRFGLPGEIISDNGKQFSDNPFKDWCEKLNIIQRFASVKHPQSNGLVERANQSLGEGIKARLDEGNTNWIEELPHILWAHRTMIKSSHGDTPFSLTYGTKAVIPAEIRMPTYRTAVVNVVHNNQEIRLNLDLLEERRECAAIREAKEKLKMTKYYNTRVRSVTFRPRDFVYCSNEASHAMDG